MNRNFEQHVERCVVRVLGRTENGTGFWVLPDGYCLTCFHVILDRRRRPTPEVDIQYGNRLLKARYCPDLSRPDKDVAVLQVDDTQSVAIDYVILGPAELDAQVRVFGFREDEGYRITGQLQSGQSLKRVGEVHNLAHTSMPDGASTAGMSGAPVYDHRRQIVVGMYYGQEREGPAISYVHPIEKVYESWPKLEARNAATLRSGLQRFGSMTAQAAEGFERYRTSHPYAERSEFREIRTKLLDLSPFQPDFWIVVGQAGIGKSTLLLHLLQWSLQDGRYFPIWLDQDCFSNHSQRLLQLLDCPVSDWGSRLQDYAQLVGRPLLLFVDSLDAILPSLDPTKSAIGLHDLAQSLVIQLNELASNAVLVCSSRPVEYELLSEAGIPRAKKLEIDELSEGQVRQIVSQAAKTDYYIQIDKLDPKLIEMCRNPFILHLLLEASKMEPLPEISGRTATHIKELYWRKRVERVRPEAFVDYRFGALEKSQVARAKATIAHRIARAMVKAQAYRLPMKTLEDIVEEWIVEADSDDRAAIWSVYRELVAEGVVTERNAVTFLHDSFADFVICRGILSSDRPYQEIDRWLENIGSPFYVTVTVRLILQARDTAKSHIESRIYDGMLETLARKRESQAMMNRSWGVTYALRQVAYVWVERLCASLQEHCTQETASSIASVLEDLRHPAVVPALIDGMQYYRFKKRFVDGLGKSEDPSAVEPLLALLGALLSTREDDELIKTIALALGRIGDARAQAMLAQLAQDATLPLTARREARKALWSISSIAEHDEVVPYTETETIEGLRIRDRRIPDRYSDWKTVKRTAERIASEARQGQLISSQILAALIEALDHEHEDALRAVVQALVAVESEPAIEALVAKVLNSQTPDEARRIIVASFPATINRTINLHVGPAIIAVLTEVTRNDPNPQVQREARRALESAQTIWRSYLDKIASIGAAIGIDDEIVEFMNTQTSDAVFAVGGAVGLLQSPLRRGWKASSIHVGLAGPELYPLDPIAVSLLRPYQEKLAGMGWETKYRVARIDVVSDQGIVPRVTLVPTTFEESTGFHRSLIDAVAKGDDDVRTAKTGLAKQLMQPGDYHLPGVAVIHAIVVTNDNRLVLCQRSPNAGYHPSAWSVSFEEQINQSDFVPGSMALLAAARRGFQEEFAAGSATQEEHISVLGVFLEYSILNIGFCVQIEAPFSFAELKLQWEMQAKDGWEAVAMTGEPFTLENAIRLLRSEHYPAEEGRNRFHATSKYRLLLATIKRFGMDALLDAFKATKP